MKPYFLILFILSNLSIIGQVSKVDSVRQLLLTDLTNIDRVNALHKLSGWLANTVPDSALIHAREAFALTEAMEDVELHSRSFRRMGHALYSARNLDEFRKSLLAYIRYCKETNQPNQIAASYRNLSKIGERTKQPDSTLFYLNKCISILEEHPDTITFVDVHLSKGLAYKYKGNYEQSIDELLKGLRISEQLDRPHKMGYLHQNIAITYAMMKQHDKSAFHSKQGIVHFIEDGNQRGITRTQGNLALAYLSLDSISAAVRTFEEAIESAPRAKMSNIAMHSQIGLADIYFDSGEFEKATVHINEAEKIAKSIDHQYRIGSILRFKAILAIEKGEFAAARRYKNEALQYLDTYREPSEESSVYFEMSEIYAGTNDYKNALELYKKGRVLNDSLFTIEKEQQFEELNLIYETEKKDAAIEILNQKVELDSIRKKSLWGGIGLIGISSLLFIYSLIQKKKKEKEILLREKNEEVKKREVAELELDFKKKELMTKVLQLAGKNEFLQKLEEEVKQLKSSVDDSVSKASQKISRMIRYDGIDEDEWNQFAREFGSVHPGFMDELTKKYGNFSQSETRLITLLKLNLSSKDMANILRVSDEGIKKARYRLRKKMGLEKGEDLQGIIVRM